MVRILSQHLFGKLNSLSLVLGLLFAFCQNAQAQVSIAGVTPVTENFDGMSTGTSLPSNWKVTSSFTLATTATTALSATTVTVASTATLTNGMGVSGTGVPAGATITVTSGTQFTLSAGATGSGIANGATLLFTNAVTPTWSNAQNQTAAGLATNSGNATGRAYNYRDSTTTTDRAVGFQGGASYASPMSLIVNYKNTNTASINALSISYKAERYRINSTAASVDFYYSTDGSSWTAVSAANVLTTDLPTGTAKYTFKAPNQTVVNKTASITGISIPNNGNIYIRWNFTLSTANSQGIAIDDISTTASFAPCAAPSTQATSLTFPSTGTGQISGSFTAASGGADGYLVVRYPNGGSPTSPTNVTVYTAGTALGAGTVVYAGPATSFTASGLSISTSYDFYVYSYNATSCVGGPIYNSTSPLLGTKSTSGCPTFSATVQIDPSLTRTDGSIYNTLTDALNDISGCPVSQATVFQLNSGYVSSSESFPLVLGAVSGMSATNTITIRPASGASNLSISGAKVGNGIIILNAGTYWRIDGRSGGTGTTQNLTVENTDNTLAASTAITFINGAQNNIITYCKVRSSNIGVASGSITFSTSTTVGNSDNTVSNCDVFYSSTGNLPNVGISSIGSAGFANDNNTIANNRIYDFFNAAGNSYGIYISDNTTNWNIYGNSIYETAARTLLSGTDRNWAGIGVSPTTASSVEGLVISGNYIGGSAANCGGSAMSLSDNGTGNIVLRGIFVQAGTGVPSSIQGNTIQNISISSSSTSTNQSLISAVTGRFEIGTTTGNTLGSATGTGSISFTQTTSSSLPRFSGIIAGVGVPGDIFISNNSIGSISVGTSGAATIALAGIYATGASNYTIGNNNIGSGSTANSIQNNTSGDTWGVYLGSSSLNNLINNNVIANMNSGTGRMLSIRTDGGTNSIVNNTIRNNVSASTGLTGNIGIWQASTAAGQTISLNTIHSLSNSDASAAAVVQGIYYTGPTTGANVIEKNFVHSLSLATSSTTAAMYGIRVLSGAFPVTLKNNMVRLGVDAIGSGISTGYAIYGMYNSSSATISHYHNTLYIGGSSVSGTSSNTIAFFSSGATNTRAIQNNIFQNARDGGSTGKHYAAQIGGSGANPTGLTCNNNLYHATGSNGILMLYASADRDDLAAIRTATGQDGASVSCDPKLKTPNGSAATVDLHIQASPVVTQVEGNAAAIGSVTDDFDGQNRASLTPNDIGADAGNFTAFVNPAAGSDSPVCANGTLNLTVTPNASMSSPSYSWTGNGTFSASSTTQNPSVSSGLVVGTSDYTVTITDANGCVSISTVSVLVNSAPTVGSTATSNLICSGTQVTLNGSGAVAYSWDNGVTNNVAFTPSGTTTYTVTGTDANGCQNTSTETITISPSPTLGSVSQPAVCSGSIAAFNLTGLIPSATFTVDFSLNGIAQTPFTGLNSDASGEASFNSPVPLTSANNGQVLAITGLTRTDASPSCSKTFSSGNSVTLAVNPTPSLSGVSQSGTACDGQFMTINLTGLVSNSLFSFGYSIGGVAQPPGFGGTGAGTSTSFPIAALLANDGQSFEITNITITSASPNCSLNPSSGNTFNLSVKPRPTVQISANDFVCQGQSAPIEFYFTGTGPWTMNYKINGASQTAATPATSPLAQTYSNATAAQTYDVVSLSDANCSAIAAGLDSFTIDVPVPCSVTWNGSVSGDWNDKDNWTPNNSAPSTKTSVLIPGGTSNSPMINSASPAPVCASLSLSGNANPSISSGFSLNVRGDLTGNYYQTVIGDGKLVLSGTGTQTITGFVRVKNLEFNNTSSGGVVVAPGANLQIEAGGIANFSANAKFTNNGTFKLASSAGGTAKIGPIPTTASISGLVSQERFVNRIPGAGGAWYFMASPFGGKNFTDWADDFKVTGLSSGFGSQGGDIISSIDPERTSIFKYVEATHNQQLDSVQKIGWTIPGAAENIIPGTGYRTYINYYSNGSQKFDNTGTLTRGDFTFPSLTRSELSGCVPSSFDCQEANWRGWNLLGNPYPSDIDWESATGWTKPSQMANGWYRWNAAGTGFGVYAAGTYAGAGPNPSNPSIIPSGQAFFVRLTQAGNYSANLVVKEAAKTTSTSGQFARIASEEMAGLRVTLSRQGEQNANYYSSVIRFSELASDAFDQQFDFAALGSGEGMSISIPVENEQLVIAGFAPVTESKTIPIKVDLRGQSGQFVLHFSEMDFLETGHAVYLRDNLLGTLTAITSESEVEFAVSGNDALVSNRFDLLFQNTVTSGQVLMNNSGISVFPNPASSSGKIDIQVSGSNSQIAAIRILDATGRILLKQQIGLKNGVGSLELSENKLSSGIYFLEVNSGNQHSVKRIALR
jgi:hypothetical protein